jgi:hypothetical protein
MSRKRNHKMAGRTYRQAVPTMHAQVMAGLRIATVDEALRMAQQGIAAVEAVAQGKAQAADWGALADVVSMLDALATLGQLQGRDEVLRLMTVLTGVLERRAARGTATLYAAELADLRALAVAWADAAAGMPLGKLRQAEQMVLVRNERILRMQQRQGVALPGQVVLA